MAPFKSRRQSGNRSTSGSPMALNDFAESSGTSSTRAPPEKHPIGALRSRFSPRLSPDSQTGVFQCQQDTYPASSSRSLLSSWGRRDKGNGTDKALPQEPRGGPPFDISAPTPIAEQYTSIAEQYARLPEESAEWNEPQGRSAAIAVPRFDTRGYPIRAAPELKVSVMSPGGSPQSKSPHSPQGGTSPGRSPRPRSTSSDDGKKYIYPPTAYVDSARGSTYSDPATPARSRRSSDASGSDSMYGGNHGMNRVATPGASLFGDSTHSFDTQHTDASRVPFTSRDALRKNFEFSPSATGVATSYNDYTFDDGHKGNKGAPVLVAYLDDPAAYNHLEAEDDDFLHDPADPDLLNGHKQAGLARSLFTVRGAANIGCMALLVIILVTLFMGYPVITAYTGHSNEGPFTGYALTNATGQVPIVYRSPIDVDTPQSAHFKKSMETGEDLQLVFSDEFNTDGRTFYPGDDPYWEAVDLHYWPTNNLEWYDPKQLTTRNGSLVITFTDEKNHGLNYTGGMMSTWNKFCFTGGYMEASVSLPGTSTVNGLWPAVWTMGNLGRAGYGGTNDGLWPYSYNECDLGTLKNQTLNGKPKFPKNLGDKYNDGDFSYLPGQRFSACTCPGDPSHPGPILPDGSFVGRAAPEIDMFEAAVEDGEGHVSLSGQWAPFSAGYSFLNGTSDTAMIVDTDHVSYNSYQGSVLQQATSALSITDQNCYTRGTGCFSIYGFEYEPKSFITWRSDDRVAWTIRQKAMGPEPLTGVGQRDVSVEPMYMIMNLGMSENFGPVDFEGVGRQLPVEMHVDYIRVYQHPDRIQITCDPPDYPTADFIAKYPVAYNNANISSFEQLHTAYPDITWPKNRLIDQC